MSSPDEIQCILILDLSKDNPITERSVTAHLPEAAAANRRAYRVTKFGAERASQGGAPDRRTWRDWTVAVDRMLAAVRADLGDDAELAHYYIAGRASLPMFSYLGVRLGKQARITAINQRPDGHWDVVPFKHARSAPHSQGAAPVFNAIKGIHRGMESSADGKVVVFVSSQRDLEEPKIRAFAGSLGVPLAGIVTIQARPDDSSGSRTWMSAADGPRAAAELEDHFTTIRDCYPHHHGLMVFVAGPTFLAAMVGWAINPRLYTPVWLPYFRNAAYEPAVEVPWPLVSGGKPRILIVTANPSDEDGRRLDIDGELGGMFKALQDEVDRDRCELRLCPAATANDLMDALSRMKPHIVHFSGHGEDYGLVLLREDGVEHFVPDEAFRDMLVSTTGELHLIVLNACRSSNQARALAELADCAIGTQLDILDDSAKAFSGRFYRALVDGCSVSVAFKQGKALVRADDDRKIFELHPRDGVDPAQVVFFSPAAHDR